MTTTSNTLRFFSEKRQAWIDADQLPSLARLDLDQLRSEVETVKDSLKQQISRFDGNDTDWLYRAELKLRKTSGFLMALARENQRRRLERRVATDRLMREKKETATTCKLNAFRRLLAEQFPEEQLNKIWSEAKRQGAEQYKAIEQAVQELESRIV